MTLPFLNASFSLKIGNIFIRDKKVYQIHHNHFTQRYMIMHYSRSLFVLFVHPNWGYFVYMKTSPLSTKGCKPLRKAMTRGFVFCGLNQATTTRFFFVFYDKQRILRTFYNPNTQPDTQGPNYCRVSLLFHRSQSMCVVNITTQKWSFFIHPFFWNITTILYACFTYNDYSECTYLIKQTNSNLK